MARQMNGRIASVAMTFSLCVILLLSSWSGVALAQTPPTVSIEDVALPEGDEGDLTTFSFRVLLSAPAPAQGVGFFVSTRHGNTDDNDYEPRDRQYVSLSQGETETSMVVAVAGDRSREADETFFLDITDLDGANAPDPTATGTILNDDLVSRIIGRDIALREGDSGQSLARVRVELDWPADEEVRVTYETYPDGARPDEDFIPVFGQLVFAPGVVSQTVEVLIVGDTRDEPTEALYLGFVGAVGAEIGADARIDILTDDAGVYSIQPAQLADGRVGERYDQGFSLASYPNARFEFSAGALPPGIAYTYYAPNGRWYLLGYPTTPGVYPLEVVAYADANSTRPVAYASYTITIADHGLTLPAMTLPHAVFRGEYTLVLDAATGGSAPYRYALTAGALPPGLRFEQDGSIAGYPEVSGDHVFTVSVTDSSPGGPFTVARDYTLFVEPPRLALTSDAPLEGTIGESFSVRFLADGLYTEPLRFSIASGALPDGLRLDADGLLSGTPRAEGEFVVVVDVLDSTQAIAANAQALFFIRIAPPALRLLPPPRFEGRVGQPFDRDGLVPIGGVAPYTFQLVSGVLPAAMTLGEDGRFLGIPEQAGDFPITVLISDSTPTGVLELWHDTVIRILPPGLVVTPAQLPAIGEARAYSVQLQVEGGVAPYRFALESGDLPPGMTLSEAGEFAGAPAASGQYSFGIRVSDASDPLAPKTAVVAYTLRVEPAVLLMEPESLPPGVVAAPWRAQLRVSGGAAPYRYSVSAGSLPPGLALVEDEIVGTPTAAGSYAFEIQALDSATGVPRRVVRAYSVQIGVASAHAPAAAAPTIVIDPATLPGAIASLAYAQTFSATGGTAPYTFTVTAGALPAGLRLHGATGAITGTPTAAAMATFTVTATDALGFTGTRSYTLAVSERPDPTRDADVRGLLNAQAAATRRFGQAQTENFQRRLESLHRDATRGRNAGANDGFSNTLGFSLSRQCVQAVGLLAPGDRPGERCGPDAAGGQGDGRGDGPRPQDSALSAGARDGVDHDQDADHDADSPVGLWVGGTLRSGGLDGRGGGGDVDFETDGVSVGADYRFGPSFVFGGGLGFGRDKSRVGDGGSRIDGEATTAALYASWHPGEVFYLDVLLGRQRLDYTLRRRLPSSGNPVRGERDGAQWFVSVSAGGEFAQAAWRWVPYGRIDLARARLEAYTESGDPLLTLRYAAMDLETTTGSLGLRVDYRHDTAWGTLSPQLRLEYQHDFDADAAAGIRYADGLGPFYRAEVIGDDRDRWIFGAGAVLRTDTDWSLRLEYRGVIDGAGRDNALMFNIEKRY